MSFLASAVAPLFQCELSPCAPPHSLL
jgi:hypothetical protein